MPCCAVLAGPSELRVEIEALDPVTCAPTRALSPHSPRASLPSSLLPLPILTLRTQAANRPSGQPANRPARQLADCNMPLYTIYHPSPSSFSLAPVRSSLAALITRVHSSVTGAAPFAVKVIFVACPSGSSASPSSASAQTSGPEPGQAGQAQSPAIYSGGHPDSSLIRIIATIKSGRDAETRARLLATLLKGIKELGETEREGLNVEMTLVENRSEVRRRILNAHVSPLFIPGF